MSGRGAAWLSALAWGARGQRFKSARPDQFLVPKLITEVSMEKLKMVNEKRVLADFERLSKERKKEAADFIAYLKIKEELEATKEALSDRDFLKSIMKGDADFKAGRFKKWSEVKESV